MRANATCRNCGAVVRVCVDEYDNEIVLRPDATAVGYVYPLNVPAVDGFTVVRVVGTRHEVPSSEPLAYSVHLCDNEGGG